MNLNGNLQVGIDLKFHCWPGDDNENELATYTPSVRAKIKQVSWCNDNNYLVLLSEKGNPEIISTRNKRNIKLVHTVLSLDRITASAFQRTTKRCLSLGSAEGQVALYDTRNRAITKLYTNLNSNVKHIDFNIDDMYMAAGCENGIITLFGMIEGEIIENFKMPNTAEPTVMRFHPELPKYLAAASINGGVIVWDINSMRKVFYAQSHTSGVSGIAMSSSRGTLISVGQDHKLCVYDLNICECLFRNNLQQPLSTVDLHSNGNLLAVGLEDGYIYEYDMRNLIQPVYMCKPHNTRVNKILFTNNVTQSDNFNDTASRISIVSPSGGESDDQQKMSDVIKTIPKITSERDRYCDSISFQKMKEEVFESLQNHMNDLSKKMTDHFNKFKAFMDNEFLAIDCAIEDKCNLLNIADFVETNIEIPKKD